MRHFTADVTLEKCNFTTQHMFSEILETLKLQFTHIWKIKKSVVVQVEIYY